MPQLSQILFSLLQYDVLFLEHLQFIRRFYFWVFVFRVFLVSGSGRSAGPVIAMEVACPTTTTIPYNLNRSSMIVHNFHNNLRGNHCGASCFVLFGSTISSALHKSLKPWPWYLSTTASYGRTSLEDRCLPVSRFLADSTTSSPLHLAGPACFHFIPYCLSRCSPNLSLLYCSSR